MANNVEDVLLIVVLLVGAFVLPLIPAIIARRKGYSFWGLYLFAFLCWLPATIVVMCLTDRATGDRFRMGN